MRSLIILFIFAVGMFAAEPKYNAAVIFMYHRFDEKHYPSTSIDKEQFAFHLEYLKTNGYNVWSLSKIVRYIKEKKQLPPKTVALTMDDAYRSVYTVAYPMLKEKGFPFTVFVNTLPVDNHSKRYLTWDQMRQMQQNGAEFANHSWDHPYFVKYLAYDDEKLFTTIRKQIEKTQHRLQEELGKACNAYPKMFAYPFGEYTHRIEKVLQRLGYVGVTQVPGVFTSRTSLLEIPRYPMAVRFADKEDFLLKLHTQALPLRRYPNDDHLVLKNPPILRLELKRNFPDLACYSSSGERLELRWISKMDIEISAKKPLNPPRDHYTCTAKVDKKHWYWYSFFWVFPRMNQP